MTETNCELCTSNLNIENYTVPSTNSEFANQTIVLCSKCLSLIENPREDLNHWRCLSASMWSDKIPVQVMVYRLLNHLSQEVWARDLLDQLFLNDDATAFANAVSTTEQEPAKSTPTKDSNGSILMEGDSVTLIKDLEVKGAGFTAKRGTLVKNISLSSNPLHIEGKVNGTQIVLLTCFLKKVI